MLRSATEEERKDIEELIPLQPDDLVVADKYGNIAVLRLVWELDPVIFRSGNKGKAEFIGALEYLMKANGIREYYFEADSTDEKYCRILEKWGAVRVSEAPGYRYKRELNHGEQKS